MCLHILVIFLSIECQEIVLRGCFLLENRWTKKHKRDEPGMRFVVTVLGKKKHPAPFAHIILSASAGIGAG